MANYRERSLTDSPTGPSFSTARRERSENLSHIRKTLNPGVPGLPLNIFRRFRAMACLPRGRLAYRGSIQLKATRPFTRSSSPTYTLTRRREFRQPKTTQPRKLFAGKIRSAGGTAGWRQHLAEIGDPGFTRAARRDLSAGRGASAQGSRSRPIRAARSPLSRSGEPARSAPPDRQEMDPGNRT